MLVITRAHWEFYMLKKVDLPLFRTFTEKMQRPSIHTLIPHERDKSTCLHNTLASLRVARRRGELVQRLTAMANNSTGLDAQKRMAYCKKWVARIKGSESDRRRLQPEKCGQCGNVEMVEKVGKWGAHFCSTCTDKKKP